jgi:SET domain-containing protein
VKRQARQPPFRVRRSKIHGRGVFATRRIRAGTRIIEYRGERITAAEAELRYDDDAMDEHHTFLFEIDDETIIDAAVRGNAARFINHSCDPNCASFVEDGRVYIEAVRNIQPGAELTYDYQYKRDGMSSPEWELRYVCYCGAAKCRGTILKQDRKRRRKSPTGKRR